MRRVNTSHLCIICILANFISMSAHAFGFSVGNGKSSANNPNITTNRPWGNIEASKPAQKYQAPPPPPNNYFLGASPDTGWYTAQPPGYSTAPASQPRVEVEIAGSDYYEHQNIVYTVRVISDGNLKSLDPVIPRIEGAILELREGPVASTRKNGHNKQQIVNSYRFKLMPLRSGKIVIPAIRFAGTHVQGTQMHRGPGAPAMSPASSFNIAADKDLTVKVRPSDPAVNPWLPLHKLNLDANLQQEGPAKAGEPVTLTVELKAKGALGNQLPTLARQLESSRYRIYRDATAIKNGISANGDYLTGSRKETYTIIPLEDGWIRLPRVEIAWWDVDSHSARVAELPFGVVDEAAASRTTATSAGNSMYPVYFWAPLVIAMSLIAGIWLGAWRRTRPLIKAAAASLSSLKQRVIQTLHRVGVKLSPEKYLRRFRMSLALLMPRSIKLWMCTRCLSTEDNPEAWCTQFKSRVCQHLDLPTQVPLTQIAEKIITTSPQTEPARLRTLARSLDAAIYGGNSLDFPAWKRELVELLRPRLFKRRQSQASQSRTVLPALNPRSM